LSSLRTERSLNQSDGDGWVIVLLGFRYENWAARGNPHDPDAACEAGLAPKADCFFSGKLSLMEAAHQTFERLLFFDWKAVMGECQLWVCQSVIPKGVFRKKPLYNLCNSAADALVDFHSALLVPCMVLETDSF